MSPPTVAVQPEEGRVRPLARVSYVTH